MDLSENQHRNFDRPSPHLFAAQLGSQTVCGLNARVPYFIVLQHRVRSIPVTPVNPTADELPTIALRPLGNTSFAEELTSYCVMERGLPSKTHGTTAVVQ